MRWVSGVLFVALTACTNHPDLDATAERLEAELTLPDGYALTDFERHYAQMNGEEADTYLGVGDLFASDDEVLIGLYLYGSEPVRHVYGDWSSMPQADHPCLVIVPLTENGEFAVQPELSCSLAP